jgi:DNA mismatch repair protein MSH6
MCSSGRKTSVADDDDFIVPSDSDAELKSTSSRSRSRASSSVSRSSRTDDEFSDSSVPAKSTSKARSSGRPSLKKTNTGSGATFLTAAEQRVKGTKAEKKESPYAFLQEGVLKDVSRSSHDLPSKYTCPVFASPRIKGDDCLLNFAII